MTSYFLYYLKKGFFVITYLLAFFLLFYYTSATGLMILFFACLYCLFYYFFYSKNTIIKQLQAQLVQGTDVFLLNTKVLKISKALKITPPKIYLSKIDSIVLFNYCVSKNNRQIFISQKLLEQSTSSLLEAYLVLSLSQIKTKIAYKNAIAYFISNIFFTISSKVDLLFSVIFGINSHLQSIYKSPFSSLVSVFLYYLNSIFLTQKQIKKSDALAAKHYNSYYIEKALWNLNQYCIHTSYKLPLSYSLLFILNPLEKKSWFTLLDYQGSVKLRIKSINNNYPIF